MGSFGENLRREREMRGISLDEIAGSTKISVRFLQAMENDDFANLPGGIFTRSFIRSYAKYLGLDDEQVMSEFQMMTQTKDVELGRLMFASSSNSPRPERRPLLLPIVLAVTMLAGGYSLFRYTHRHEETPVTTPGNGAAQAAPSPAPSRSAAPPGTASDPQGSSAPAASSQPPGPASVSNGVTGSLQKSMAAGASQALGGAPNAAPAGPAPERDMVLKVAATQRVWVSVDADGKTALQRTLSPQDTSTITAKDHFDLVTANAQALTLTLNGEMLKPLGRQGEVKKVHLTHSDVKAPSP
jgi:cytoskeleton protein RodZ